jgi:ATP adenylyltransferase
MHVLQKMTSTVRRSMSAEGFNVGVNLGKIAGAGLPGHLHWHLVPRWSGDTNYMPVLANVNVIPQSLAALYELLTQKCGPDPEMQTN